MLGTYLDLCKPLCSLFQRIGIDGGQRGYWLSDVPGAALIPELAVKPAHRRGKSIEESWIRSGGSTRKASRQEIGALLMNSSNQCWEELRASPLLALEDVQDRLDLEAMA